jgi:hypothetical protein
VAHRVAGSDNADAGRWTEPLGLGDSPRVESDLERAA